MFLGGRALKLIKGGVDVTNASSPLTLVTNITLTVVDCCISPLIRLAAHCLWAGAVIKASVASPSPVTIG